MSPVAHDNTPHRCTVRRSGIIFDIDRMAGTEQMSKLRKWQGAIARDPKIYRRRCGENLAARTKPRAARQAASFPGHDAIVLAEHHSHRNRRARFPGQRGDWKIGKRGRKAGKMARALACQPEYELASIRNSKGKNPRGIDLFVVRKKSEQRVDKIQITRTAAALRSQVNPAVFCFGKDDRAAVPMTKFDNARAPRQQFDLGAAAVEAKQKRLMRGAVL